jgi:hypothetical protein
VIKDIVTENFRLTVTSDSEAALYSATNNYTVRLPKRTLWELHQLLRVFVEFYNVSP